MSGDVDRSERLATTAESPAVTRPLDVPAQAPPPGAEPTREAAVTSAPDAASPPGGGVARGVPAARGPRRARLAVRRVNPWSVLRFTLVYSIALLVILVVAVAALYAVLVTLGVFDSLDAMIGDLTDAGGAGGGLRSVFSAPRVIGGAALIGLANVVLVTALATLGAVLYNLCADLAGGIEVTFAERE